MIFERKKCGLPVCEIWYDEPKQFKQSAYWVCQLNCMGTPYQKQKGWYTIGNREALTLVNDLSEDEQTIYLKCSPTTRNEINRASRENATSVFYSSEELIQHKEILMRLNDCYISMFKSKDEIVEPIYGRLLRWAKYGALMISIASIGDLNELVFHVYLVGDSIARLLYSCSDFRNCTDKGMKQCISRLNRKLHYDDMLWLKKENYTILDWGGYSNSVELAGINHFKEGFGGKIEERFFYTITKSKLLYLLMKR